MGWERKLRVVICGLLWGALGGDAAGLEEVTSPGWEGVGEVVAAGLDGRAYPGAVVVVGQPGRVLWAKAYGAATYGEGAREMGLDAVFDLASVTKVVATATAALLLVDFQVLARAIEGVAGVRMEELLRVRVYGPLGMKDTGYRLGEEQLERAVPTARQADGTDLVGRVHDPLADYHGIDEHSPGNAGLFSTAGDLARYCEMWLGGGQREGRRVFSPPTLQLAASEQTPPEAGDRRGLGWDIYETEGYMTGLNRRAGDFVIGHAGFTGPLVWMDLRSQTYLVFLCNRTYPYDGEMEAGVERETIGAVRKKLAEAVLRALSEYEGWFGDRVKEGGEEGCPEG